MSKRKIEVAVISDVHLGTYGCHAKELQKYLKSIDPKILVLNGDIIDIWQFRKSYWPESHTKVIQRIVKMIADGTQVYYLTGNHDEILRRYTNFKISNFKLANKLLLKLDGKKVWFFHGDVFDVSMRHSKWLAKAGAVGYDFLILINRFVNVVLEWFGKEKYSLSKKIKNSVKKAVQFINDFELTAIEIALDKEYDCVVCGHIHQPAIRDYFRGNQTITYMNSGDWIENLTSLEYNQGEWSVFKYSIKDMPEDSPDELDLEEINSPLDISYIMKDMKVYS